MGYCKNIVYAFLSAPQRGTVQHVLQCSVQREHCFEALQLEKKEINTFCRHLFKGTYKRVKCCLKSNCSTSFLASPCFCCLFTFWQSLNLFCYFQTVTFHICIYFPVEIVLGLQRLVCWLLFSLSLPHSLLQHSFAMPFHPLPSYCRAPFELFKSGLGYCSIPFNVHKTLPLVRWAG